MSGEAVTKMLGEPYRLALAESQSIMHSQEIERVVKEMEAIGRIRASRLLKKANRLRRNSIYAAVCLSCCAVGFLVAFSLTLKNSTSIPTIAIQGKSAQWNGKVVDAPAPNPAYSGAASAPAAQINKAASTTIAAPVQVVKVDPALTKSIPQPVRHLISQARSITVQPKAQSFVLPAKVVPATNANKPTEKASDQEAEVVLPVRVTPKEISEARFQEMAQISTTGNEFKVVNVIEGAVVVRQGQTVKQFKVGDQLPSGKILKSVDTESLKFEVSP